MAQAIRARGGVGAGGGHRAGRGAVGTSSLRLDGATGDWRGASEGSPARTSPKCCSPAAARVVHFHGLDGQARRHRGHRRGASPSPAVTLSATTGGAPVAFTIGLVPAPMRVPVPPDARRGPPPRSERALSRIADRVDPLAPPDDDRRHRPSRDPGRDRAGCWAGERGRAGRP